MYSSTSSDSHIDCMDLPVHCPSICVFMDKFTRHLETLSPETRKMWAQFLIDDFEGSLNVMLEKLDIELSPPEDLAEPQSESQQIEDLGSQVGQLSFPTGDFCTKCRRVPVSNPTHTLCYGCYLGA